MPEHLVGLCFNCLGKDHVRINCTFPSRCFTCLQEGHQARDCPRARSVERWPGKHGRSPKRARSSWEAAIQRRRRDPPRADHGPTPSVSTERAASATPEPPSPELPPQVSSHQDTAPAAQSAHSHGTLDTGDSCEPRASGDGAGGEGGPLEEPPAEHAVVVPPLRHVQQRPASPRTRAREPLLEMVVIPRSAAMQEAEDALASLVPVAMVVGTRPPVSLTMVREHLQQSFGIGEDMATVRRFWSDDFIVRFTRREDLDLVLGTPPPLSAPFTLRWRPWSRLIRAIAGSFRYRVLVGMKGIPAHARSEETAQRILGLSCAHVQLADDGAVVDPDDERELFVAT